MSRMTRMHNKINQVITNARHDQILARSAVVEYVCLVGSEYLGQHPEHGKLRRMTDGVWEQVGHAH